VRGQLELIGVPTVFVDQRLVLETEVDLTAGDELNASLQIGDQHWDLGEVTAVYQRPYLSTQLSTIVQSGTDSAAWRHACQVDDALASWCDVASAFVVNRSAAMAANDSKPYQLQQIRKFGWSVPETLITTDQAAARSFWEQHREVVYKSISGIRSRVSRLRLEHLERFSNISCCPTQFQRYVAGTDYRVHVVGSEVFACEVLCDADDYRYPTHDAAVVRTSSIPGDVEERCRTMALAMQLPFAGIDLRRTPDGEWFCFEVNPSPGFTYYENAAGQPISRAVAELLTSEDRQVPLFASPLVDLRVASGARQNYDHAAQHFRVLST
jgi:glutathione synthase/RimK-type ligase-like ATP-grasp enzyme